MGLSIEQLMVRERKYLLVASFCWLYLDYSIAPIEYIGRRAMSLYKMQKANPDIRGKYYHAFRDFNGHMNHTIFSRLLLSDNMRIENVSKAVIRLHKRKRNVV